MPHVPRFSAPGSALDHRRIVRILRVVPTCVTRSTSPNTYNASNPNAAISVSAGRTLFRLTGLMSPLNQIKRIKVGSSVTKFLIDPEGSRVYASVNADNNVAVVDLKTLGLAGRISSGVDPDGLAWVGTR
jgi:DNA-binding beta-propeller fold protein YncE